MLELYSSSFILPKAKDIIGDDACDSEQIGNTLIAVLCDGVGSATEGGKAARQSVKMMIENFRSRPNAWDIPKTLKMFIKSINHILYQESQVQYERPEMVTTICTIAIEEDILYGLNIGDSRVYLLRDNNLMQLTVDHTMDEEGMSHVLTRALGLSPSVEAHIFEEHLQIGDTVIMCSDGVYNILSSEQIVQQFSKKLSSKIIINNAAKEYADYDRDDMSLQYFTLHNFDKSKIQKNKNLIIPNVLKTEQEIDGYRLLKPLAEHKRVWLCEHENKKYVIKFPLLGADEDEQLLDMFIQEAWIGKQINNTLFAKASVPENRTYRYYILEHIDGLSLHDYVKERRLSVDSAILLAKTLLKAEQYLLNLGYLHADIKPENIIVYKDSNGRSAFKVVDFGSVIAPFSLNSRAGTPSYISPERFEGSCISEKSELFSIGITIFWALTKTFPYGEIEPFQTPKFKPSKRPSKLNSNIPKWFEAIIMRSIAVDTTLRYTHYSQMMFELRNPEKVKPFFRKDTPLLERNPLLFFKTAFYLSLILNFFLILKV